MLICIFKQLGKFCARIQSTSRLWMFYQSWVKLPMKNLLGVPFQKIPWTTNSYLSVIVAMAIYILFRAPKDLEWLITYGKAISALRWWIMENWAYGNHRTETQHSWVHMKSIHWPCPTDNLQPSTFINRTTKCFWKSTWKLKLCLTHTTPIRSLPSPKSCFTGDIFWKEKGSLGHKWTSAIASSGQSAANLPQ